MWSQTFGPHCASFQTCFAEVVLISLGVKKKKKPGLLVHLKCMVRLTWTARLNFSQKE